MFCKPRNPPFHLSLLPVVLRRLVTEYIIETDQSLEEWVLQNMKREWLLLGATAFSYCDAWLIRNSHDWLICYEVSKKGLVCCHEFGVGSVGRVGTRVVANVVDARVMPNGTTVNTKTLTSKLLFLLEHIHHPMADKISAKALTKLADKMQICSVGTQLVRRG